MAKRPIHRLIDGGSKPEYDELADESIISIFNDQEVVVRLLATPLNLEDLGRAHQVRGRGNVDSISVNGTDINIVGDVIPRPTNDLLLLLVALVQLVKLNSGHNGIKDSIS